MCFIQLFYRQLAGFVQRDILSDVVSEPAESKLTQRHPCLFCIYLSLSLILIFVLIEIESMEVQKGNKSNNWGRVMLAAKHKHYHTLCIGIYNNILFWEGSYQTN